MQQKDGLTLLIAAYCTGFGPRSCLLRLVGGYCGAMWASRFVAACCGSCGYCGAIIPLAPPGRRSRGASRLVAACCGCCGCCAAIISRPQAVARGIEEGRLAVCGLPLRKVQRERERERERARETFRACRSERRACTHTHTHTRARAHTHKHKHTHALCGLLRLIAAYCGAGLLAAGQLGREPGGGPPGAPAPARVTADPPHGRGRGARLLRFVAACCGLLQIVAAYCGSGPGRR